MTIYTLGYSGWKIEDVEAVLDHLDAILVDVRMVPRSRVATWNVGVLSRRLGQRYLWLREFGNRNYKGGPIDIVDFAAGQAKLVEITACHGESPRSRTSGKSVILLCGCADVKVCHRKLLAEWLAKAWQSEVEHLTQPDNQVGGGQKKLF
jgi:uncharacterized protein (DUF488 family)